ncbi:hypothetical protein VaNZ11_016574, partial [Volvox africanus]
RAKDAARRSTSPPRGEAAEAAAVSKPTGEVAGATPPPRPLIVQLQPHSDVQQYDGTARGQGVNVNTIIQQLDRWCGLCDTALLQPPSQQQRHQPQKPQPQLQPLPQQHQHQQPRHQSSLRTTLQGKLHPQIPQAQPNAHPHAHPQGNVTASLHPQPNVHAPAPTGTAAVASASGSAAAASTHIPTIVPKLQLLQQQQGLSAKMQLPVRR